MARTALMTWIFLSPTAERMTSNVGVLSHYGFLSILAADEVGDPQPNKPCLFKLSKQLIHAVMA